MNAAYKQGREDGRKKAQPIVRLSPTGNLQWLAFLPTRFNGDEAIVFADSYIRGYVDGKREANLTVPT